MLQMRCVVLFYNYYVRKRHPAIELLDFETCCKLSVILIPTLIVHMKLMRRSNNNISNNDYSSNNTDTVDEVENQFSLTEKAIMDACNVSSALDATKHVPNMGGWPISKVTVLLVDSRRENCLLLCGSKTRGIWSVIEKYVDGSGVTDSGAAVNGKATTYRRKSSRVVLNSDELYTDEALQQLAVSAVKDITGMLFCYC